MQGRQMRAVFDTLDHFVSNQGRFGELLTTVHNAMTNRFNVFHKVVFTQNTHQRLDSAFMTGCTKVLSLLLIIDFPGDKSFIAHQALGNATDAFLSSLRIDNGELQRRTATVNNQNAVFAHRNSFQ